MSTSTVGPPLGQFGRKASLIVSKGTQGLDLSHLRFRFEVRAADTETPNTAIIRIYNLSDHTRESIISEFDTVTLQAGYQNGHFGQIFQGDIKQFRKGKQRNVDSYLDIYAGDGDRAYNFGIVNQSFAPGGGSYLEQLSALGSAMGVRIDPNATSFVSTGGILPSGKVMFGMARLYMSKLAKNNNCRWSIQNGVLTLIPLTGYLPGQIVAINSASGMLGTPEATDNGIHVRCYINPLIQVGQRIQINNADINQTIIKQQSFPSYTSLYFPANVANDGIYRVLVVEHEGDTRANEWETRITCLALDPSAPPNRSVLPYG